MRHRVPSDFKRTLPQDSELRECNLEANIFTDDCIAYEHKQASICGILFSVLLVVKWQGLSPPSAKTKNEWSYTSATSYAFVVLWDFNLNLNVIYDTFSMPALNLVL